MSLQIMGFIMLETIGAGLVLASFLFLAAAIWRFAFWRGRRAQGWRPLACWLALSVGAAALLGEDTPEARAAREAEAAKASAAKTAAAAAAAGALTLADYIDLDRDERADSLRALIGARGLPQTEAERFTACLGEYAPDKSPDLKLADVFGWCEVERTNAPENFAKHFNELDAPDYSTKASIVCQNLVESQLRAPATAEFPWIPDQVILLGRHEYDITSHVDSQNGFGALLRSQYSCRIKHKGGDADPLLPASWDVIRFDLQ